MKIIICKTQQSHVLSLMLSFIVLKSNITSQPFMEEIVRIVSICRKEEKNGKKCTMIYSVSLKVQPSSCSVRPPSYARFCDQCIICLPTR